MPILQFPGASSSFPQGGGSNDLASKVIMMPSASGSPTEMINAPTQVVNIGQPTPFPSATNIRYVCLNYLRLVEVSCWQGQLPCEMFWLFKKLYQCHLELVCLEVVTGSPDVKKVERCFSALSLHQILPDQLAYNHCTLFTFNNFIFRSPNQRIDASAEDITTTSPLLGLSPSTNKPGMC